MRNLNRSQYIKAMIGEFFADDEGPSTITKDDTIIQRQQQYHSLSDPFPDNRIIMCPTCGKDLIPGFSNPHMLQCSKCFTDVDLAYGKYPYRTHAPSMSRGQYGS